MTILAIVAALVGPAQAAPSAQARAYIEARSGHVISQLNPLVARKTAGHNGKVIEWAGTLDAPLTPPATSKPAVAPSGPTGVTVSAPRNGAPKSSGSTAGSVSAAPMTAASAVPVSAVPTSGGSSSGTSAGSASPGGPVTTRPSVVVSGPPTPGAAAVAVQGNAHAVPARVAAATPRPRPADVFATLHTHGGDTFQVRVTGAGKWSPGKPVYVLARVVEQNGKLHHLNALAIASTNDVTLAHTETLKKAASNQPVAMRGLEGVPGLSLNSAVRWIISFNRGMDNTTAQALARSVLVSCSTYGVDARLALSLFAAESAFRIDAVSGAGAQGLGQLMPGTAGMLGVRNAFNPFENADASIRHLGYLLSHWRGTRQQVEFALAAYNAGAGAVEQYGGIPPYAETVTYVRTILGYYTELARYP